MSKSFMSLNTIVVRKGLVALKVWQVVAGAAIMLFIQFAHADTFLTALPGDKITPSQAANSKDPSYKCERVIVGPNVNPVKVPGSTSTWHSKVGTGIENVGARLASGEPTYRCKLLAMDNSTGRMRKAVAP